MSNLLSNPSEPIFSRDTQVEQISSLLSDVQNGSGRIVLYEGEAGIGKSRLLDESRAMGLDRGFSTVKGRCFQEEGVPPLWPWIEIIREIAAEIGWDRASEALGRAAAYYYAYIPELGDSASYSGYKLGIEEVVKPASNALFECGFGTLKLIQVMSENTPLLLTIDDIQWADNQSLGVLTFVARSFSSLRSALLITMRSLPASISEACQNAVAELTRLPYYERVLLDGMTMADVGTCISRLTGRNVSDAAVKRVYESTDGNPLLVVQLAASLTAEDSQVTIAEIEGAGVLRGLESVVRRWLSDISPVTREILETAALLGTEFSVRLLTEILEKPEAVVSALDEAITAHVIRTIDDRDGEYRFYHELIRQAVVEEIKPGTRMQRHAAIAQRLEDIWSGSLDLHAGELFHHFRGAGALVSQAKVSEYAWRAGKNAMKAGFDSEAIHYFEIGLESVADEQNPEFIAHLHSDLGLALLGGGQRREYGTALEHLDTALRHFVRIEDKGAIAEAVLNARIFTLVAHTGEGARALAELCAANTSEGTKSKEYAEAFVLSLNVRDALLACPDTADVRPLEQIADSSKDINLKLLITNTLGFFLHVVGRFAQCLEHRSALERLISHYEDLYPILYHDCFHGRTDAELRLGLYKEATATAGRALRYAERTMCPDFLLAAKLNELRTLVDTQIDVLRENTLLQEIEDLVGQTGGHNTRHLIAGLDLSLYTGPVEKIDRLLNMVITNARRDLASPYYPGELTKCALLTDDARFLEDIQTLCYEFLASELIVAHGRFVHIWHAGLAAVYVFRGEMSRALEYYSQIDPEMLDVGYVDTGILAWKLGKLDEAVELLKKSLAYPGRISVWSRLKLGRALLERGHDTDGQEGTAYIKESLELAGLHGFTTIVEEAEAALSSLPQLTARQPTKHGLTPREIEILTHLAEGREDKEIAASLNISSSTVHNHVRNVFRKISVENRTEAAIFALVNGIAPQN